MFLQHTSDRAQSTLLENHWDYVGSGNSTDTFNLFCSRLACVVVSSYPVRWHYFTRLTLDFFRLFLFLVFLCLIAADSSLWPQYFNSTYLVSTYLSRRRSQDGHRCACVRVLMKLGRRQPTATNGQPHEWGMIDINIPNWCPGHNPRSRSGARAA